MIASVAEYRIFISSPGDVAAERTRAIRVIERLGGEFRDQLRLVPIAWERKTYGAHADFQAQIEATQGCHLVVGILWARVGSALDVDGYARPDGSAYESGTVFEIETALDLRRQGPEPDIVLFRKNAPPQQVLDAAGAQRLGEQLQVLEAITRRWLFTGSGAFKSAFNPFTSPDEFELLLERHLRDWLAVRGHAQGGPVWRIDVQGTPYPGLVPYEARHEHVFFGRDKARDAARRRLSAAAERGHPFLLILGGSGAGKSSLARAGLLPLLDRPGSAPGVDGWRVATLRPGVHPMAALVEALFNAVPELADGDAGTPGELAATLLARPAALTGAINRALVRAGGPDHQSLRLLLLADQLEEALDAPAGQGAAFCAALAALVAGGQWVIATLRADRYAGLQAQPNLLALKEAGGAYDLLPPDGDDIEAIIRGPAEAARLTFERHAEGRDLAQTLRDELGGADALPLLQMTLARLFTERDRAQSQLTFAAYRRIGGLRGAIEGRAEEVFAMAEPAVQAELPALLLALAAGLSETGQVVARAAPEAELASTPARAGMLRVLIEGRLLAAESGVDGKVQVRAAHEALLRNWTRAVSILAPDHLRAKPRLEAALADWRTRGESRRELLRGTLLDAGLGLLRAHGAALPAGLVGYIVRSRRADRWRRYGAMGGAAGVAAVFGVLALLALDYAQQARRETARAETARTDAQSNESLALVAASGAATQAGRGAEALRLALAAWPRRKGDTRPLFERALQAMGRATAERAEVTLPLPHRGGVISASFSVDGTRVVTAGYDHTARLWDAVTGAPIGQPMRHENWVTSASFSADGTRVVTASRDRTARLWNAATGAPIGPPMQHAEPVNSASFSADGTRVVTASQDHTARLWNAATAAPIGPQMRHEGWVYSASFSPDGTRVVTASTDYTARLWDATTGAPIGLPMKHEGGLTSASFSADGTLVVTASRDMTARLWNAATGAPIGQPMRHNGLVNSASFSTDGTRVVTASQDGTARLWDAATGAPIGKPIPHNAPVISASFSADGMRVVTASDDHTARLWDTTADAPLDPPMWHEKGVTSAAFSADGTRVVTASKDGTARLWDVVIGAPIGPQIRLKGSVTSASFSADGTRVVTASNDTARLWDGVTGAPIGLPMEHERGLTSASFSADGTRVVTASRDMTARLWNAATGAPFGPPMRHLDPVNSASFSADGTRVVTASNAAAQLWDGVTGAPIGLPMRHAERVTSASFSADGTRVITASSDRTARLWDGMTGAPIGLSMEHERPVISASFSADGTRVVTASVDGTARLWDGMTGAPIGLSMGHESSVDSASFSADGTRVLTTSLDSTARIWNAATGAPIGSPMQHERTLSSALFSADGTRVVTASEDHTARLWDAATGAPIGPPMRHENGVNSASFSADGTRVVTVSKDGLASNDGTARLWNVGWPPGPITAVACVLLPEVRAGLREIEVASLTARYGIGISDPICQPTIPPFDAAQTDRR